MPPFVRWGTAHVVALAAIALLAAALTAAVRRSPSPVVRTALRLGLAFSLLATAATTLLRERAIGPLHWWDVVPLQLCDAAILVAAYALVTLRPLAAEIAYFWAGSGTLLALLMPDLAAGFPSWWFLSFFALHGGVVVAAVVLTAGYRSRLRRGAWRRAFLVTNAYALVVGLVDAATGANFMYLRAKPSAASLLDYFGPWPVYILGGELAALGLFALLSLPFRLRYSHSST